MVQWVVFKRGKKELLAYTLQGTFREEREQTIELLACEHGIPKEEISVTIEARRR